MHLAVKQKMNWLLLQTEKLNIMVTVYFAMLRSVELIKVRLQILLVIT